MNRLVPIHQTCLRLKELGFKQETSIAYYTYSVSEEATLFPYIWMDKKIANRLEDLLCNDLDSDYNFSCAAPTIQEIWDILPKDKGNWLQVHQWNDDEPDENESECMYWGYVTIGYIEWSNAK